MLPDHTHAARLVGLIAPPPTALPIAATPAVERALADSGATCLQRCLVLQAWLAAHGASFEVAIGVRTADGFEAHAWIPGYHAEAEHEGFDEIARVPLVGDGLRAASS
jgi:hypothetical protein